MTAPVPKSTIGPRARGRLCGSAGRGTGRSNEPSERGGSAPHRPAGRRLDGAGYRHNAIKYSPPDSPIGLSVTLLGDEAQVRVHNEGVGIPADERDRIFAPFYRTARTRDIPGTGLGLHISRRLAEQHRGRLWLDEATSPATGTVFALALPLA